MKRMAIPSVALLMALLTMGEAAWAETLTTICVPEAANKPVLSGSAGKCTKAKYTTVALPGSGGLATLNKILPHINYVESGVGGKPTVQFSGVNVQIVNGAGKTRSVNGEGNLVIGYDETKNAFHETLPQTGSHDVIVGEQQEFTSFGGIVGGMENSITGEFASVTGGSKNGASGLQTAVVGGEFNGASGRSAAILGGKQGTASGPTATVSGGFASTSSGFQTSVLGGHTNTASGNQATIVGGSGVVAAGSSEIQPE